MPSALQAAYDERLAAGDIRADPAQHAGLEALVRLEGDLVAAPSGGRLTALFRKPESQRGVYLWGPVGRGKSMLMDLFFETAPVEAKRRTHFHVFMGEIHRLIDDWRKGDAGARRRPRRPPPARSGRRPCAGRTWPCAPPRRPCARRRSAGGSRP